MPELPKEENRDSVRCEGHKDEISIPLRNGEIRALKKATRAEILQSNRYSE